MGGLEDRWYGKDGPQKWKETKRSRGRERPLPASRCVYAEYVCVAAYRRDIRRARPTGCVCFMPRATSGEVSSRSVPPRVFSRLRMIYDARSARVQAARVEYTRRADTIECASRPDGVYVSSEIFHRDERKCRLREVLRAIGRRTNQFSVPPASFLGIQEDGGAPEEGDIFQMGDQRVPLLTYLLADSFSPPGDRCGATGSVACRHPGFAPHPRRRFISQKVAHLP